MTLEQKVGVLEWELRWLIATVKNSGAPPFTIPVIPVNLFEIHENIKPKQPGENAVPA